MSVAIQNLVQFRRMAAVLAASAPRHGDDAPTRAALAEVFAAASAANHRAFAATYGERAAGYRARMRDSRPLDAATLAAAFAEPVVAIEPELAKRDAELLLYNTIDNDGGEHLSGIERFAVERLADLVIAAADRLARIGQTEPCRLRLLEGGRS
jgi:hypothetical protein